MTSHNVLDGQSGASCFEICIIHLSHSYELFVGVRSILYEVLVIVCIVLRGCNIQIREQKVLSELSGRLQIALVALDRIVGKKECEQRIAVMSAGLSKHSAALKLSIQVRKEVGGNNVDLSGKAFSLDLADGADKRISAAACNDQSVHVVREVGGNEVCGNLCTLIRGGVRINRLAQNCLIIRVCFVPLVDSLLIAFITGKEGSIADGPAFKHDVSVALLKKEVDQRVAVGNFIFMNSAKIVLGLLSQLVDRSALLSGVADDAEELGQINLVCFAGLDCGKHLRVSGVADDDTVAACGAQSLNRSGNLLGYVALVNILDLNIESCCSLVDDLLALRSENVSGAPDGDTDLDSVVRICCEGRN